MYIYIYIYIYIPVTGSLVKHSQPMSSLHFRLGDTEIFVNDLLMRLHNRF